MFVAARRLLLLAAGRSRLCVRPRGICRVAKRDRRFASFRLPSLVGTAIRLRGNLRRTYSAAFEAVSIVLWARLLVAWCRAIGAPLERIRIGRLAQPSRGFARQSWPQASACRSRAVQHPSSLARKRAPPPVV